MSDAAPRASKLILWLRSGLFSGLLWATVIVYAILSPLTFPLAFRRRYLLISSWGGLNVWLCERICKLGYRVEGLENVPDEPSVVMANHQSTWETLVLEKFFPPMAWVVKRELMWIPFFGWGLAMVQPIALDRRAGKRASEQLLEQARWRLADGRWLLLFPEGTRVPPGQTARYKLGGALVAANTGAPVVPVAHNAGLFWPRRSFFKHPGTITVCIGPPIDSRGKTAETVNREVKAWIDAKKEELRCEPPTVQNRRLG